MSTMEKHLRDKQELNLAAMIKFKKWGLWDDPGVGKTPPVCVFIYYVWKYQSGKTIWAMPTHLMEKNRDELLEWTLFKPEDIAIVDGTRAQKDKLINSDAKVFIVSFPGLVGKRSGTAEWKKYRGIKCIALDEPHKYFSNDESPSTQELYKCVDAHEYFVPMTGTIVKGRLDSAYPMIRCINSKYYGNYRDFLNQHAIRDYWNNIIGWRNHDKLAEVLKRVGSRTSFEEAFGERNMVFFIEEVSMSTEQQAVYNEYRAMGAVELDRVVLEGANEGVNLLRLRQILAHPEALNVPVARDAKGRITRFEHRSVKGINNRDERLKLHVEDHLKTGEPLVIVSTLIPEQTRLYHMLKKMGAKVALINSTVSNHERSRIDRDFQAGKIQMIVGSPSTMGTGFNWSHLDHIIFCALDFVADDFIQMLMRAFRGVREKSLRLTLIQYKKSVEQDVDRVIDRKSRESHYVDPSYLVLNLSPENRVKAENVFYN